MMNEVRTEMRIREEIRRRDRSLIALIDEQTKRTGRNYLARLIKTGAVRLNRDGSLRVAVDKLKQQSVIPSDYQALLKSNRERDPLSPRWIELEREVHQQIKRNNIPLTALHSARLAAFELNMAAPMVRCWLGDEPAAFGKSGWIVPTNVREINIVCTEDFGLLVETVAHEVKHCEQLLKFPQLTPSQREADADQFGRAFAMRVFA